MWLQTDPQVPLCPFCQCALTKIGLIAWVAGGPRDTTVYECAARGRWLLRSHGPLMPLRMAPEDQAAQPSRSR
jgi:hypothetical protein